MHTVIRRLLLWTLICGVSAVPSFIWASADDCDRRAMLFGVVLFILAYTTLTSTERFQRFHDRPFMRRTLYIGYGTRLAISIIFPIGMTVDVVPGIVSYGLAASIGRGNPFAITLLATVIQGGILNIIIVVYMALVLQVQRLFCEPPQPPRGFEVIVAPPPVQPIEFSASVDPRNVGREPHTH